jgi:hypothetical protein
MIESLYGDVQGVARGSGGSGESGAKLREFLLKGGVGGLGVGKIAGLQILAELGEKLFEGILRAGGSVQAGGMMMMAMVAGNSGRFEILEDGGGEIARFEIGGQLIEGGSEAGG